MALHRCLRDQAIGTSFHNETLPLSRNYFVRTFAYVQPQSCVGLLQRELSDVTTDKLTLHFCFIDRCMAANVPGHYEVRTLEMEILADESCFRGGSSAAPG